MARVLAISSWVARGHVGLGAIVPILQRRGCETIALPTVILSNHLGHGRFAGGAVPVEQLAAMLDAIAGNGWLSEIDAVLTGYLPTAAHVSFAKDVATLVRGANPGAVVFCDPVLGDAERDDPGALYVPVEVADAVKAELLPLAHCVTPNRFELHWLTGQAARSPGEAVTAARMLGVAEVVATSIPAGDGQLATVGVTAGGAWAAVGPELSGVPHGTGDALMAMLVSTRLAGVGLADSLAIAAGGVGAMISASLGAEELQLVASQDVWAAATAADVQPI